MILLVVSHELDGAAKLGPGGVGFVSNESATDQL